MKIVCDNCTTKYQIADEKVSGKAFKIRCKKCGHVIVVNKSPGEASAAQQPVPDPGAATEAPQPAAEAAPPSDAVWHLVIDREQVGPMTAEEVKAKIRGGQVDAETYGWKEGFEDWLKLSAIDNFKDDFNRGGNDQATKRLEPATVQQAPQGATPGADLFAAAPQSSQPHRAASAQAPTLVGDADSIEAAAHAAAAAQAAARAAEPPVSSGQESEALGSGKGMKGARSENSVLFSLNNLSALAGDGGGGGGGRAAPTSAAQDKPGYANVQSEASGLIDIRAMAAATLSSNNPGGPSVGRGPDMLMGADVAPVFAPVATNMLMPSAEPPGIPKWVFALVGVGGLAIVGMIVFLVIYLQGPSPGPVATGPTGGSTVATGTTQTGGTGSGTTTTTGSGSTTPEPTKTPTPGPDKAATPGTTPPTPSKGGSDGETHKRKGDKGDKEKPSKSKEKDSPSSKEKEPEIPTAPAKTEPPAPKKEKPAKAKDDLDSLLDTASSGSGGKPKAAEKKDLPEQLSMDTIKGSLKNVNVGACKGEGASGTYMVKLTIGRNGKVSDANVSSGGDGKDCVAKAVKGARFSEFSGDPMSLTYPFIVR